MGKLDLVRESHSISEIAVQLQQRVRRGRSGNGHSISEIAVQLQQRSPTNLAGGGGDRAPEKDRQVDGRNTIPHEQSHKHQKYPPPTKQETRSVGKGGGRS